MLFRSVPHWRQQKGWDQAPVDAYLVRPVRQAKLLETLATVWSLKRGTHTGGDRGADEGVYPRAASSSLLDLSQSLGSPSGNLAHNGRGASFVPQVEAHAAPCALCGKASAAESGARVLVVEDNAVNQRVAVTMLAKFGIRAEVAANGREGLEKLRAQEYDLVFVDCQMPEMNGYEATTQIRRMDNSNRQVPVVAMTAQAIDGSRERCLEHGMDDFIAKPVKLEDLKRALEVWLRPADPEGPLAAASVARIKSCDET